MDFFKDLGKLPIYDPNKAEPKPAPPGVVPYKKPRHTTLGDLVQRCPACNHSVVWPFTMDYEMGIRGSMDRRKITGPELQILKVVYGQALTEIYELGTRIKSYREPGGRLWHFPCWMLDAGRDPERHGKANSINAAARNGSYTAD